MNLNLFLTAAEQAGIFSVLALGIYITYKILDFPDLTVDGSFPLGGAITAAMISRGCSPLLAMPVALLAGALAGLCTGMIHVRLKVRDLLAGIIMMTALYSVNLLIAGKANIPITTSTGMTTLFSNPLMARLFGENASDSSAPLFAMRQLRNLILLLLIILLIKCLIDLFLKTRLGYLLRAEGDNDGLVKTLAQDGGRMKILGLAIANALVSLSGSLYCQYSKAFNLTDGTGKMVIGLAAVIIGVNIFGRIPHLKPTTAVVIGSIVYNFCVAAALKQVDSNVKNLVTAILFLIILQLGRMHLPAPKAHGKGEHA